MSLFATNPELRACFESDAVSLIYQLQTNLDVLSQGEPDTGRLVTFHELAHTLRGAAALVEVTDIANVCSDFMRLGEVADSCKLTAWDKAREIFVFIRGKLDALLQAVIHALANEDAAAAALCQEIHSSALERWKDYFYDGNVTDAEGGFSAFHSVGEPAPIDAASTDSVSGFLDEVEQAPAPAAGDGQLGASRAAASTDTAGEFLGTVAQAGESAPEPGHNEAAEFLASIEEAAGAPENDEAPSGSPNLACPSAAAGGSETPDSPARFDPSPAPAETGSGLATFGVPGHPAAALPDAAPARSASEEQALADFLDGLDQAPPLPSVPADSGYEAELAVHFYEDVRTNLAAIEPALQAFEADPEDASALKALHLHTHTIKGAARTSGFEELGRMTNAVEDVIEACMERTLPCAPAFLTALVRRMAESLRAATEALRSEGSLAGCLENLAAIIAHAEALRRGETPAAEPAAPAAPGNSSFEADLLPFFFEDAFTNMDSLEDALHRWEENPEDEASLQAVYRHTHTIKGAANSTGLADIGSMVHAVEDVLEDCVGKTLKVSSAHLASLVYEMIDGIKAGIRELQTRSCFGDSLAVFSTIIRKAANLRSASPEAKPAPRRRKRRAVEAVETAPEAASSAPESPAQPEVAPAPMPPVEAAPPAPPVETDEKSLEAAAAQKGAAGESPESQTIRVSSQRLDAVMNLIGELIISRTRLDKKIHDITKLKLELNFCKTRLLEAISSIRERFEYSRRGNSAAGRRGASDVKALGLKSPAVPGSESAEGFSELEFDRYDEFNIMARSLVETGNDISEVISQLDHFFGSFNEESGQFNKTTTHLQNEVTRIRMVPLTFLFRRLQRAVRDAAVRESKEVDFQIAGGETQLDKNIIDEIYSPLLHLVRNAVSHGIEAANIRSGAGKSARGRVSVRAFQESNQVVIEVSDDGAGLNFTAIRAAAIERGLLAADADSSEEELTPLIFRSGFSTAKSVSQISGRGVGMNVVSNVISRLNGTIDVRSRPGQGATFTVRVPLTLAINQAMMITVSGQRFALPLSFVEHIVPFRQEYLILSGDRELWRNEGASLPFLRLDRVLGLPPADTRHGNVVFVRVANKSLAILVDEQLTRQDIVVKPLGALLADTNLFSAATLSGDGQVLLILDLPKIERSFHQTVPTETRAPAPVPAVHPTPAARRRTTVLVVDDSLSVRKVAEKYLSALGYDSILAVDGLDALERLRAGEEIAAVLTDLEMPRMHGFELIAEIRQNPALHELPVIVVTSRDAEKHRKRAADLGANGYITKPFTREQLAERLEALITTTANA